MVRWRSRGSLEKELASFGVRSRQLSAARLSAYPEVLQELFGDQVVADAKARKLAAESVEAALRKLVAAIEDKTTRRVAQAVLSASEEFYGKSVTQRLEILEGEGISGSLYKARRPVVLSELAASLRQMLRPETAGGSGPLLSPDLRHQVRQLHWYMQWTLLYLESFALTALVIDNLEFEGDFYKAARCVIGTAGAFSDRALWSFAHFLESLSQLDKVAPGRDFLREYLPALAQHSGFQELQTPFFDWELQEMRTALAACSIDEPDAFGEFAREHYSHTHDRFLVFFSSSWEDVDGIRESDAFWYRREETRQLLVDSVATMDGLFPEDALPISDVVDASGTVYILMLLYKTAEFGLVMGDAEGEEAYRAYMAAMYECREHFWILRPAPISRDEAAGIVRRMQQVAAEPDGHHSWLKAAARHADFGNPDEQRDEPEDSGSPGDDHQRSPGQV